MIPNSRMLSSQAHTVRCAPPHLLLGNAGEGSQGFLHVTQAFYQLNHIPSPK